MRNDDLSPANGPPPKGAKTVLKWAAAMAMLAVLAATLLWFAAGATLGRALDNAQSEASGRGAALSFTPAGAPAGGGWDGFPLTAKRRFAPATLDHGPVRLAAAEMEVAYDVLRPQEATARLQGVVIELADGRKGSAESLLLIVNLTQRPLAGGGALPRTGDIRLTGAAWEGWRVAETAAAWRFPDIAAAQHNQTGLTLTIAGSGLTPPAALAQLVTDKDERGGFAATATVMGAPPALTPAALELWRTDGGVVELTGLRADFAPLSAEGDFTLALDRNLQIIGAGGLRLSGADAALNHAAKQTGGPFKPKEIKQARQAALLLTQPDPDGGAPKIALPLSAQDHGLFIGPFQVMKLPPLVW